MDAEQPAAVDDSPDESFERAPFGYLHVTPDWTILKANQTLLDLLGLHRDELIGRRFPSLLAVGDRIYHETHLAPLLRLQGSVKEVAVELLGSEGRRHPALLSAVLESDQDGAPRIIRVGIVDVRDRRHYERELLAARERAEASETRERALQIVIADLAVAVTTEDVERAVVAFLTDTLETGDGTLWLLGHDGRTLHRRGDAVPPLEPIPADEPTEEPLGRALVARTVTSLPDGTIVVPLTSGARAIGVVTAARPGAVRITGEERSLLHSLGSQAGQVLERTQLYESRDWMLGMVAHDLRTPLGTIGGLAETLQRIDDSQLPTSAKLLSRIVQTSARLTRLTDDLLDASAASTGQLRIEAVPVRLGPLLTRTVEDHRLVATDKRIELELENELGDTVVSVDAGRFAQVMDNIVSNALKYSPVGSRVTVIAHASSRLVHIGVIDRGPGIEPHELPYLFTPFRRTSNEATAGERSTGLGLAIADRLIAAHGGTIAVESIAGLGTTFTVELPRQSPTA